MTTENRKNVIYLVIIGFALYLFALPAPLTDGDTKFYSEIASSMVGSGDWVVLQSDKMHMVDKPPMSIWLMAASFRMFGESPLTTRAWHVLMAISCVVFTYLFAREFFSPKVAFNSGLILLASVLFYYMGFVPQQDIPALFFICLGMLFFAKAVKYESLISYYGVCATLGLNLLNRGLSGFLIPAAIMGASLFALILLKPDYRLPFKRPVDWIVHVVLGIAVMAAVAGPWYYAAYKRQGFDLIRILLMSGNARFFQNLAVGESSSAITRFLDWISYLPLLLVGFLPWSALIWPSISGSIRRIREEKSLGDILCFVWAVVAFAMVFAIRWRVIRYLIPVFPPLSIITAYYFTRFMDRENIHAITDSQANPLKRVAIADLVVVVPLFALVIIYFIIQFQSEVPSYLPIFAPVLLGIAASQIAFSVLSLRKQYKAAFYSTLALSMSGLVIAMILLPRYFVANF